MRSSSPQRFENLNLLRAFAVLSVVVYHVIEHAGWKSYPGSGPLAAFRIGWYGVDLFFVISGFVITYSALILYRADQASFRKEYWIRRLSRILPLYLLTLFLYLAFFPPQWDAGEWLRQLATHLTFTHGLSAATHGTIDGPNWSLAIEMQFYLLVALLIGWIDRVAVWKLALLAIGISWAWRAAMFLGFGGEDAFRVFVAVTQLPGTLDQFAAGIVLAKLLLDGRQALFARSWPWLIAAAACGYVAMQIFWAHAGYWSVPGMVILWRTLLSVFFLCVLGAAISLPQSLATRWLRPLNYLGETSYGIYLWHLFAINIVVHAAGWMGVQALAGVLGLTIAAAALSWHGFEKPFMQAARKRPAGALLEVPGHAGRVVEGDGAVGEVMADDGAARERLV